MDKNKPTIIVNDKEMSLFGAKLYLLELRFGLAKAELSDNVKEDYTKWKTLGENRNDIAKKLKKKAPYSSLSERSYLIEKLGDRIESLDSPIHPKVHAHKPKEGSTYTPMGIEGVVTQHICIDCGQVYEDNTSSESISNPFRG